MTSRIKSVVAFFCFLGASHYLFTPAYNGYLLAFVVLAAATVAKHCSYPRGTILSGAKSATILALLAASILVTANNGADWRDIFRDFGVFLAFMVGRFVLPGWVGADRSTDLLRAMSVVGTIDSIATLLGAVVAYRAGADAYEWRGIYVPFAHNWLPYLLLSNVALARLEPQRQVIYWRRLALCVLATLASLSRTDIVLYVLFALAMILSSWRAIFSSRRRTATFLWSLAALMVVVYASLGLSVVQERLNVGVGEDDPSVGWRVIEDLALLEHFDDHDLTTAFTGFGWGARVPLPAGITDFDDNDSIPFLHNSLLTVVLKFGLIGLAVFLIYISKRLWFAWRTRRQAPEPRRLVGLWIVLFNLANSVTLQGLSEWSQVVFLGIGCFLLLPRTAASPGLDDDRMPTPSLQPEASLGGLRKTE